MKTRNLVLGSVLAATTLGLLGTGVVSARPYGHCDGVFSGRHAAYQRHGMHRGGPLRHFMKRLDLTEEQRDQIFEIRHAQRPAVREKMKELRKGREALRDAAMAETYDPDAVRELAEQQAKIQAELIVMRNATRNQIYGLFTAEQREEVARLKEARGRP